MSVVSCSHITIIRVLYEVDFGLRGLIYRESETAAGGHMYLGCVWRCGTLCLSWAGQCVNCPSCLAVCGCSERRDTELCESVCHGLLGIQGSHGHKTLKNQGIYEIAIILGNSCKFGSSVCDSLDGKCYFLTTIHVTKQQQQWCLLNMKLTNMKNDKYRFFIYINKCKHCFIQFFVFKLCTYKAAQLGQKHYCNYFVI